MLSAQLIFVRAQSSYSPPYGSFQASCRLHVFFFSYTNVLLDNKVRLS